jgi:hypothetical protein
MVFVHYKSQITTFQVANCDKLQITVIYNTAIQRFFKAAYAMKLCTNTTSALLIAPATSTSDVWVF